MFILLCPTVAVHSQLTISVALTVPARVLSKVIVPFPCRGLTLVPQVLAVVVTMMVPIAAAKIVRKEHLPKEIIQALPALIRFSSVLSHLEVLGVQAPVVTEMVMGIKDRKARQKELALRVDPMGTHLMIRLLRRLLVTTRLTLKSQV